MFFSLGEMSFLSSGPCSVGLTEPGRITVIDLEFLPDLGQGRRGESGGVPAGKMDETRA